MRPLFLLGIVVVPMLGAFTLELWIWSFRPFRKVRERAPILDDEAIPAGLLVASTTTQVLRETDHVGDKIVITHHLHRVMEHYVSNIVRTLGFTNLATLLVLFTIALGRPGVANASLAEFLNQVTDVAGMFWTIPVVEVLGIIFATFQYHSISDQTDWYRSVLN